jgi:hypothetical protein
MTTKSKAVQRYAKTVHLPLDVASVEALDFLKGALRRSGIPASNAAVTRLALIMVAGNVRKGAPLPANG